ncbi:MAG: hypothetical protein AAGE65_09965 [Planctomycetota bacterium]
MLLTILVVLTLYLLACYAYGAALLIRRGLLLRKERGRHVEASVDAAGVVTHRYPTEPGVAPPMTAKAAA